MRMLLIRHAESIANREGRMSGSPLHHLAQTDLTDELTGEGATQAQRLGRSLAEVSWKPTHVYSSPFQRCTATATLLRAEQSSPPSIPLILDDRLREIENGILAGLTWPEARSRYPDLCQALESSLNWIPIPEAESPLDCHDRARSMIQDLHDRHGNHPDDRLWLISHGGILPYVIAAILGSDRTWGMNIPNLACFEFSSSNPREEWSAQEWHNTARWQIHRFGSRTEIQ